MSRDLCFGLHVQAVLVLEAAQVARRVSAPLRLAAMGLYGLLGAPNLAVENYTALDIKHIQHDTLSGQWATSLCSLHRDGMRGTRLDSYDERCFGFRVVLLLKFEMA